MFKIYKIEKNLTKVNNIFPIKTCNKILQIFKNEKKWKNISQIKKKHYSHVFKSNSKLMPDKTETYIAKFFRSENLKNNLFINNSIEKYIKPILKKLKIEYKYLDVRCHKFIKGNLLRAHIDNYAASHTITINLNKKWKADWGGLLCVLTGKKNEKISTLCPDWNSLNIVKSDKKEKSPHFVTNIESYAKEPRFSITIFIM